MDFRNQFDVAIVGAGFCGTMLAVRLANARCHSRIALVDGKNRFGSGLAYGTERPEHLLNVWACNMSAYPERPDHFVWWLQTHPDQVMDVWAHRLGHADFLPRLVYGRYLRAQLHEACRRTNAVTAIAQRVVDISQEPGGFYITFANGRHVHAASCVLATGNASPSDPPFVTQEIRSSKCYAGNPWDTRVVDHLGQAKHVVLLGSGLTAMDIALTTKVRNPDARITMISRHGRLPLPHASHNGSSVSPLPVEARRLLEAPSLRALVREVRSAIERSGTKESDWRLVVDAIRPQAQNLWSNLGSADRARFLRHARSLWEVHRHRAAPQVCEAIGEMKAVGRLQIVAARVRSLEDRGHRLRILVSPSGTSGASVQQHADLLVNCTGPLTNYRLSSDPLWQNVLARGLATVDGFGLGINTGAGGCVTNVRGTSTPGFYAIGSLLRPSLYETTAVPELGCQVKTLADQLLDCTRQEKLVV